MTNTLRPPPDISASAFFESWLPSAFRKSGREAPTDAPSVQVSLSGAPGGPEGGSWLVVPNGPSLDVQAAADGGRGRQAPFTTTAHVWIRQAATDFLAAFNPDPDLPPLLPPGWGALDLLFLDERDVALVKQIAGRF